MKKIIQFVKKEWGMLLILVTIAGILTLVLRTDSILRPIEKMIEDPEALFRFKYSYDVVRSFDNIHFVHLKNPDYYDDQVIQRRIGREVCDEEIRYCEVYFFKNRGEIPASFPIDRSVIPVGLFEYKNGKQKLRALF